MDFELNYRAEDARKELKKVTEEEVQKYRDELERKIEAAAKERETELVVDTKDYKEFEILKKLWYPLQRGGYKLNEDPESETAYGTLRKFGSATAAFFVYSLTISWEE